MNYWGKSSPVSVSASNREAQSIYYSIASMEATRVIGLLHELFCSEPDMRVSD